MEAFCHLIPEDMGVFLMKLIMNYSLTSLDDMVTSVREFKD